MKEWHRTVILLALIGVGVAFLLWTNHVYQDGFVHTL